MDENRNEAMHMTDTQFAAHLEELKIIVEKSQDKEEIIEAIERIMKSMDRR